MTLRNQLNDIKELDSDENLVERHVIVGEEIHTFPNNEIKTSRYTLISFLPLNMF